MQLYFQVKIRETYQNRVGLRAFEADDAVLAEQVVEHAGDCRYIGLVSILGS